MVVINIVHYYLVMMVIIYVIIQFHCIFVQINAITLTKVRGFVMNFVVFHMDIETNVFAKILIIIYVIKNALYLGKQVDVMWTAL
jgi:hypothetical protein